MLLHKNAFTFLAIVVKTSYFYDNICFLITVTVFGHAEEQEICQYPVDDRLLATEISVCFLVLSSVLF